MLLAAATVVSSFWFLLVIGSGFTIWTDDTNLAGLTIQAAIILSPLGLYIGLKASADSRSRTIVLFIVAWAWVLGVWLLLS